MRKIALLSFVFCLVGIQSANAQVRDLFAEFEEEATTESSTKPAAKPDAKPAAVKTEAKAETKSEAKPAAKVEAKPEAKPAAKSEVKAEVKSSASVPASSSSEAKKVASSSSLASSSSVAKAEVKSSASVPASSSEVKAVSSSSEAVASSSSVAEVSAVEPAAVESSSSVSAEGDSTVSAYTPEQQAANEQKRAAMEYAARVKAHADSARRADSLAQAKAAGLMDLSSSSARSSSSINRRDLLGPVKVSKVNSIDEMKGRYKNPRKALFMSLVIPGSGQLYVGGSTLTYVRGGVYLALEALLWANWGYYSVHKYNKQVNRYKNFAKEHYSIGKYENGMRDLYNTNADLYGNTFANRYMGTRKSFCEAIYGKAGYDGCYHEDAQSLFKNDPGHVGRFVKNPVLLEEEIEKVGSFSNASEVFQLIADDNYVLGWDDLENATLATNLGLDKEEIVSLGESENLGIYRSMRNKANDYADMQAWFFGGLILNHIVSAIDAALTANAHNKGLYQEDLSWYDHLHFDSGVSFVDGFNMNVRANWGF